MTHTLMKPVPRPALRRLLGAFLTLILWAVPPAKANPNLLKAMEEEIASLMEKNRPSVVSIQAVARRRMETGPDGPEAVVAVRRTVGSGIIFDNQGHVLTTGEVIGDADDIQVSLASGQTVSADLMAVDEDSKVAVLRLRGEADAPPRFGDSDRVRMGHYAFVIGNACGTMAPSVGNVVEVHGDGGLIQISGSAWPGNSGAPVFNSDGQVVGIVRGVLTPAQPETASDAGRPEAWNVVPATLVAIPINRARQIARELMTRGWLGVGAEFNRQGGTPRVFQVVKDGPADAAGLRVGDVLLSYNGSRIVEKDQLERLVRSTSPGDVAQMELQRDGQQVIVQVRVGRRETLPARRTRNAPVAAHGPDTPEMLLQRLRALEQQMRMLILQQEGKQEK